MKIQFPTPPATEPGETFRHKARGSFYTVLGRAVLQTGKPIGDDHELVVYQGEDGELWARPVSEFYDGRFERLAEIDKEDKPAQR